MADKTHDLTNGWYLNLRSDGTATVRNPDKGQRIELSSESMQRLRDIFQKANAA